MQLTRRRVVLNGGRSFNLLARSFSKSGSSTASDRLSTSEDGNVEVGKKFEDSTTTFGSQRFVSKSFEDCSPKIGSQNANGILEPLQRRIAGLRQMENANPHDGFSVGITFTNPAISQRVHRGSDTIFGFSVKEDQFSDERYANRLVSSGGFSDSTFGKYFRKADFRGGLKALIVRCRGSGRHLHTEMKGEKDVVEKSEEVATIRKVRSTGKTKTPTSKRRRMVTRVVPTSVPSKTAIELEVSNSQSLEEDLVPTSSTELALESQTDTEEEIWDTEEEIGTAWKEAFREMDDDDLEETQGEGLGFKGKIVLTPSVSVDSFKQVTVVQNEEISRHASAQAMALLRAALDEADEEDEKVEVEFQRSLRVGIVGAPNAGKSLLTNQLVGSRVSAVSRKTNTTHREHLGVFTKGETQLLYYDTPGLHLDIEGSPLRVDAQHRVRNAWEIVDFCEALVVLVDAERQIRRPDMRVQRLVEKLGKEEMASQKRVLCLNKVDIIKNKRTLLPLAKQFEDLHGYDRIFMISGATGSGVKDVTDYLVNQAVLRPWDEDPENKDHRDIALEVVREQVFEHLHEELPHTTRQKLVSWKVLKDGSIRIQQLLLVAKKEHQKILVGKDGAVIGDIGIKSRKELTEILGTTVHLVLDVKLMTGTVMGDH